MKRLLLMFSILAIMNSCLGESYFSDSSPLLVSFEYSDGIFNKDSLYYDTGESKMGFAWDYLAFYHKVDEQTSDFHGGFLLSRLFVPESGNTEGLNNRYRANSKAVKGVSNKFAVFYQGVEMPDKHMVFHYSSPGVSTTCTMQSMYVNNTVEVAEAVKSSFQPGQKLILKVSGYVEGQETPTGEAELKLADMTAQKDSIVSSWTSMDLSKLGAVDYVKFNIDTEPAGLDVPKAVCIDFLVANIAMTSKQ